MTAGTGLRVLGPAGCSFALPHGWLVLQQDEHQLVAIEETTSGAGASFQANVVLTASDNGELSFGDWQTGTDQLLPRRLEDYQLIDLEKCQVAGRRGGRRLAQHVVEGPIPVTMEQWFTQVGSMGYTVTASVSSWRYDSLAEDLADFARTLRIDPTPPGARR